MKMDQDLESLKKRLSTLADGKLYDMIVSGREGMRSDEAWHALHEEWNSRFGTEPGNGQSAFEKAQRFCPKCLAATETLDPGNIGTVNGTGARWYGAEAPCPTCGSVVRTLRASYLWIPLSGGVKYRVIEYAEDALNRRFVARRLRNAS